MMKGTFQGLGGQREGAPVFVIVLLQFGLLLLAQQIQAGILLLPEKYRNTEVLFLLLSMRYTNIFQYMLV